MVPKRLQHLVELLPVCRVVADVGTDHAYLLIEALRRGKADRGIGIDKRQGPLAAARQRIRQEGLADRVELRLGFGLRTLSPGETDVIVAAGMGGNTIRDVLRSDDAVARASRLLYLSPHGAVGQLRGWLLLHGFALVAEDLAEEEHLYDILVVQPSTGTALTPGFLSTLAPSGPVGPAATMEELARLSRERLEPLGLSMLSSREWLAFGPLLLEAKHPLLSRRIAGEIARLESALEGAASGRQVRAAEFQRAYQVRLAHLKEVRTWLSGSIR